MVQPMLSAWIKSFDQGTGKRQAMALQSVIFPLARLGLKLPEIKLGVKQIKSNSFVLIEPLSLEQVNRITQGDRRLVRKLIREDAFAKLNYSRSKHKAKAMKKKRKRIRVLSDSDSEIEDDRISTKTSTDIHDNNRDEIRDRRIGTCTVLPKREHCRQNSTSPKRLGNNSNRHSDDTINSSRNKNDSDLPKTNRPEKLFQNAISPDRSSYSNFDPGKAKVKARKIPDYYSKNYLNRHNRPPTNSSNPVLKSISNNSREHCVQTCSIDQADNKTKSHHSPQLSFKTSDQSSHTSNSHAKVSLPNAELGINVSDTPIKFKQTKKDETHKKKVADSYDTVKKKHTKEHPQVGKLSKSDNPVTDNDLFNVEPGNDSKSLDHLPINSTIQSQDRDKDRHKQSNTKESYCTGKVDKSKTVDINNKNHLNKNNSYDVDTSNRKGNKDEISNKRQIESCPKIGRENFNKQQHRNSTTAENEQNLDKTHTDVSQKLTEKTACDLQCDGRTTKLEEKDPNKKNETVQCSNLKKSVTKPKSFNPILDEDLFTPDIITTSSGLSANKNDHTSEKTRSKEHDETGRKNKTEKTASKAKNDNKLIVNEGNNLKSDNKQTDGEKKERNGNRPECDKNIANKTRKHSHTSSDDHNEKSSKSSRARSVDGKKDNVDCSDKKENCAKDLKGNSKSERITSGNKSNQTKKDTSSNDLDEENNIINNKKRKSCSEGEFIKSKQTKIEKSDDTKGNESDLKKSHLVSVESDKSKHSINKRRKSSVDYNKKYLNKKPLQNEKRIGELEKSNSSSNIGDENLILESKSSIDITKDRNDRKKNENLTESKNSSDHCKSIKEKKDSSANGSDEEYNVINSGRRNSSEGESIKTKHIITEKSVDAKVHDSDLKKSDSVTVESGKSNHSINELRKSSIGDNKKDLNEKPLQTEKRIGELVKSNSSSNIGDEKLILDSKSSIDITKDHIDRKRNEKLIEDKKNNGSSDHSKTSKEKKDSSANDSDKEYNVINSRRKSSEGESVKTKHIKTKKSVDAKVNNSDLKKSDSVTVESGKSNHSINERRKSSIGDNKKDLNEKPLQTEKRIGELVKSNSSSNIGDEKLILESKSSIDITKDHIDRKRNEKLFEVKKNNGSSDHCKTSKEKKDSSANDSVEKYNVINSRRRKSSEGESIKTKHIKTEKSVDAKVNDFDLKKSDSVTVESSKSNHSINERKKDLNEMHNEKRVGELMKSNSSSNISDGNLILERKGSFDTTKDCIDHKRNENIMQSKNNSGSSDYCESSREKNNSSTKDSGEYNVVNSRRRNSSEGESNKSTPTKTEKIFDTKGNDSDLKKSDSVTGELSRSKHAIKESRKSSVADSKKDLNEKPLQNERIGELVKSNYSSNIGDENLILESKSSLDIDKDCIDRKRNEKLTQSKNNNGSLDHCKSSKEKDSSANESDGKLHGNKRRKSLDCDNGLHKKIKFDKVFETKQNDCEFDVVKLDNLKNNQMKISTENKKRDHNKNEVRSKGKEVTKTIRDKSSSERTTSGNYDEKNSLKEGDLNKSEVKNIKEKHVSNKQVNVSTEDQEHRDLGDSRSTKSKDECHSSKKLRKSVDSNKNNFSISDKNRNPQNLVTNETNKLTYSIKIELPKSKIYVPVVRRKSSLSLEGTDKEIRTNLENNEAECVPLINNEEDISCKKRKMSTECFDGEQSILQSTYNGFNLTSKHDLLEFIKPEPDKETENLEITTSEDLTLNILLPGPPIEGLNNNEIETTPSLNTSLESTIEESDVGKCFFGNDESDVKNVLNSANSVLLNASVKDSATSIFDEERKTSTQDLKINENRSLKPTTEESDSLLNFKESSSVLNKEMKQKHLVRDRTDNSTLIITKDSATGASEKEIVFDKESNISTHDFMSAESILRDRNLQPIKEATVEVETDLSVRETSDGAISNVKHINSVIGEVPNTSDNLKNDDCRLSPKTDCLLENCDSNILSDENQSLAVEDQSSGCKPHDSKIKESVTENVTSKTSTPEENLLDKQTCSSVLGSKISCGTNLANELSSFQARGTNLNSINRADNAGKNVHNIKQTKCDLDAKFKWMRSCDEYTCEKANAIINHGASLAPCPVPELNSDITLCEAEKETEASDMNKQVRPVKLFDLTFNTNNSTLPSVKSPVKSKQVSECTDNTVITRTKIFENEETQETDFPQNDRHSALGFTSSKDNENMVSAKTNSLNTVALPDKNLTPQKLDVSVQTNNTQVVNKDQESLLNTDENKHFNSTKNAMLGQTNVSNKKKVYPPSNRRFSASDCTKILPLHSIFQNGSRFYPNKIIKPITPPSQKQSLMNVGLTAEQRKLIKFKSAHDGFTKSVETVSKSVNAGSNSTNELRKTSKIDKLNSNMVKKKKKLMELFGEDCDEPGPVMVIDSGPVAKTPPSLWEKVQRPKIGKKFKDSSAEDSNSSVCSNKGVSDFGTNQNKADDSEKVQPSFKKGTKPAPSKKPSLLKVYKEVTSNLRKSNARKKNKTTATKQPNKEQHTVNEPSTQLLPSMPPIDDSVNIQDILNSLDGESNRVQEGYDPQKAFTLYKAPPSPSLESTESSAAIPFKNNVKASDNKVVLQEQTLRQLLPSNLKDVVIYLNKNPKVGENNNISERSPLKVNPNTNFPDINSNKSSACKRIGAHEEFNVQQRDLFRYQNKTTVNDSSVIKLNNLVAGENRKYTESNDLNKLRLNTSPTFRQNSEDQDELGKSEIMSRGEKESIEVNRSNCKPKHDDKRLSVLDKKCQKNGLNEFLVIPPTVSPGQVNNCNTEESNIGKIRVKGAKELGITTWSNFNPTEANSLWTLPSNEMVKPKSWVNFRRPSDEMIQPILSSRLTRETVTTRGGSDLIVCKDIFSSVPESESVPVTEPVPAAESVPDSGSATETEPILANESTPETEPMLGSESVPQTEPPLQTESTPETEPMLGTESAPETDAVLAMESVPEIESELETESIKEESSDQDICDASRETLPTNDVTAMRTNHSSLQELNPHVRTCASVASNTSDKSFKSEDENKCPSETTRPNNNAEQTLEQGGAAHSPAVNAPLNPTERTAGARKNELFSKIIEEQYLNVTDADWTRNKIHCADAYKAVFDGLTPTIYKLAEILHLVITYKEAMEPQIIRCKKLKSDSLIKSETERIEKAFQENIRMRGQEFFQLFQNISMNIFDKTKDQILIDCIFIFYIKLIENLLKIDTNHTVYVLTGRFIISDIMDTIGIKNKMLYTVLNSDEEQFKTRYNQVRENLKTVYEKKFSEQEVLLGERATDQNQTTKRPTNMHHQQSSNIESHQQDKVSSPEIKESDDDVFSNPSSHEQVNFGTDNSFIANESVGNNGLTENNFFGENDMIDYSTLQVPNLNRRRAMSTVPQLATSLSSQSKPDNYTNSSVMSPPQHSQMLPSTFIASNSDQINSERDRTSTNMYYKQIAPRRSSEPTYTPVPSGFNPPALLRGRSVVENVSTGQILQSRACVNRPTHQQNHINSNQNSSTSLNSQIPHPTPIQSVPNRNIGSRPFVQILPKNTILNQSYHSNQETVPNLSQNRPLTSQPYHSSQNTDQIMLQNRLLLNQALHANQEIVQNRTLTNQPHNVNHNMLQTICSVSQPVHANQETVQNRPSTTQPYRANQENAQNVVTNKQLPLHNNQETVQTRLLPNPHHVSQNTLQTTVRSVNQPLHANQETVQNRLLTNQSCKNQETAQNVVTNRRLTNPPLHTNQESAQNLFMNMRLPNPPLHANQETIQILPQNRHLINHHHYVHPMNVQNSSNKQFVPNQQPSNPDNAFLIIHNVQPNLNPNSVLERTQQNMQMQQQLNLKRQLQSHMSALIATQHQAANNARQVYSANPNYTNALQSSTSQQVYPMAPVLQNNHPMYSSNYNLQASYPQANSNQPRTAAATRSPNLPTCYYPPCNNQANIPCTTCLKAYYCSTKCQPQQQVPRSDGNPKPSVDKNKHRH